MKERIPFLAGVIYVATLLIVATFCRAAPVRTHYTQERQACKLVEEGVRGDRVSQRLSRPFRGPDTSEYIDGKPLKYHTCKTRTTTEKAAELPENYLIIWTADWCSRCPRMKSLGERLKAEGYAVFYVDFDKNRAEARAKGIRAVPTAVVHGGGKEVYRVIGITALNQKSVEAAIRRTLRRNDVSSEYEIY